MKAPVILVLAIILAGCTSADIQELPLRPDYSSSSSSSLAAGNVLCILANGDCVELSQSVCDAFGTEVSECLAEPPPEGDSSSSLEPALPSSSSVQLQQSSSSLAAGNVLSSSSGVASSSSATTSNTYVSCIINGNCYGPSFYLTQDDCVNQYGGSVVSSCPVSSSSITPSSSSGGGSAMNCQIVKSGTTHCYEMSEANCSKYNGTPSSCTKTTLSCDEYCFWEDSGCSEISTDPGGVYGAAYSTCTVAIVTCNSYGTRFFTDSTCSGLTTSSYCYYYDSYKDCTQIGNNCYIKSQSKCLNEGGTVVTHSWCADNAPGGFYIDDDCL